MRTSILVITILSIVINIPTFAQLFRPYKCGPVLKKDNIEMFDTLNQYLDINPGDIYAEIGASSGYFNGAMAVYLNDVTFYLQDIDEACLNKENLKKVLNYYSKFSVQPITETNTFHITIGSDTKTNLPKNTFDVIYSNATYHALQYPDSILMDLYSSLKIDGTLSVRDEFTNEPINKLCKDKKCGQPLVYLGDFMESMRENGFTLVDQTDQFGYPIYKFKKSEE